MTLCYLVDNVGSYKSYDHMCNSTLARTSNVTDNVNNVFLIETMLI